MALRITEIYRSVQGESTWAGRPCTFVRTTGCDLRCRWCDTAYAFYGGKPMEVSDVAAEVKRLGADLVEITGGEPLLQADVAALARDLMNAGATVLVETGGHRDISTLPDGVIRIMDIKCPGSGEADNNLWSNMARLNQRDEVKCVVADRTDFDWAAAKIREHKLEGRVREILLSPVHGECSPAELVAWLLESGLNARMQLQLHKHIWEPDRTGV